MQMLWTKEMYKNVFLDQGFKLTVIKFPELRQMYWFLFFIFW